MPESEMPKYRSHKEVWAYKIAAIELHGDSTATIAPADEGYAPFMTRPNYATRYQGSEDDLGYYVLYADGYESWSPTKVFVEGYSRI